MCLSKVVTLPGVFEGHFSESCIFTMERRRRGTARAPIRQPAAIQVEHHMDP